jgi:hypothetical protein
MKYITAPTAAASVLCPQVWYKKLTAVYHFIEGFDLTLILTPHKFCRLSSKFMAAVQTAAAEGALWYLQLFSTREFVLQRGKFDCWFAKCFARRTCSIHLICLGGVKNLLNFSRALCALVRSLASRMHKSRKIAWRKTNTHGTAHLHPCHLLTFISSKN